MTLEFIFPTKTGKVAIIDGQEVEYNGVTSPGTTLAQAKKYYPEPLYSYIGFGTQWNSVQEQHFFKKNMKMTRSVLDLTAEELERRTDLEKETIDVRRILKEEFEKETIEDVRRILKEEFEKE